MSINLSKKVQQQKRIEYKTSLVALKRAKYIIEDDTGK